MARKRITLDLDRDLLETVTALAEAVGESRASFIVGSVIERVRSTQRAQVDAELELMASDPDVAAEAQEMSAELDPLADEAWRRLERRARRTGGDPPSGRNKEPDGGATERRSGRAPR